MQPTRPKAILSWSSGKDSAWALHQVRRRGEVELVGLFTTLNQQLDRVAMHGVRQNILTQQAAAAELPLFTADLPWPCSNADYERIVGGKLRNLVEQHQLTHVVFGDLYLEDIRAYREERNETLGLQSLFPLWGQDTRQLAEEMIAAGLKAQLCCVDTSQCPASFSGEPFDEHLLARLPETVDPCGENGEFHTVVTDGPMFEQPLALIRGETHPSDTLVYTDFTLEPAR